MFKLEANGVGGQRATWTCYSKQNTGEADGR